MKAGCHHHKLKEVSMTHTHLLCPGEDDILFKQVGVVHVFEDDGNAGQQLDLMQLHHTLKTSQKILLGFLVVVTELGRTKPEERRTEDRNANKIQG